MISLLAFCVLTRCVLYETFFVVFCINDICVQFSPAFCINFLYVQTRNMYSTMFCTNHEYVQHNVLHRPHFVQISDMYNMMFCTNLQYVQDNILYKTQTCTTQCFVQISDMYKIIFYTNLNHYNRKLFLIKQHFIIGMTHDNVSVCVILYIFYPNVHHAVQHRTYFLLHQYLPQSQY